MLGRSHLPLDFWRGRDKVAGRGIVGPCRGGGRGRGEDPMGLSLGTTTERYRGLDGLLTRYLRDPGRPGEEEGVMFQMIDEGKPSPEDRKLFWYKVGAFIVALAAFGGVIYFFAFGSITH